jgi:hypothetical protein
LAEFFGKKIGKEYQNLAYQNVNIDDKSLEILVGLKASCIELASQIRENAKEGAEAQESSLKVRIFMLSHDFGY